VKEIKAIIQPFMLEPVIDALRELGGLPGVTVSEVQGFAKHRPPDAEGRPPEDPIGYAKKVKLEIVVADEDAERVVEVIAAKAHTGRAGDGKIFVLPVDEVVRIRTGERGPEAI